MVGELLGLPHLEEVYNLDIMPNIHLYINFIISVYVFKCNWIRTFQKSLGNDYVTNLFLLKGIFNFDSITVITLKVMFSAKKFLTKTHFSYIAFNTYCLMFASDYEILKLSIYSIAF